MVSDDGLTGTPLVETEGLTGQCLSLYVRENYPCNMDVVLNEQEELTCRNVFSSSRRKKGCRGQRSEPIIGLLDMCHFQGTLGLPHRVRAGFLNDQCGEKLMKENRMQ